MEQKRRYEELAYDFVKFEVEDVMQGSVEENGVPGDNSQWPW